MTIYLRQSTASQEIPLGYFVDSTDGNTEETGLTIANTDIKIWKSGATTLANKNSGGATHISNGIYYCVLDATDTNTIGPLKVFVHVSGALAVCVDCCVLDEAVYDVILGTTALSTYAGGAVASVTGAVGSIGAGGITAASFAAGAIDAAAIAADAIGSSELAASAVSEIATAVNAEVVDALATDTYGEPTGAPAATDSLAKKIGHIYMALRNKVTITSSAKNVHDDAGNVEWSKSLSDNGTTYTENEAA